MKKLFSRLPPPSRRSAFTLVELMIVIAIIGVLAASLFPTMSSYMARARDTARMSDLRSIGTALDLYGNEHGGIYPVANNESNGYDLSSLPAGNPDFLSLLLPFLGKAYKDPINNATQDISKGLLTAPGFSYFYTSSGSTYQLGARMETKKKGNSGEDRLIYFFGGDPGMVGYWDMESMNGGNLIDLSNNHNTGIVGSGSVIFGGVGDGIKGKATAFDGTNNVNIINDSQGTGYQWYQSGTGQTVSFWFRLKPTSGDEMVTMVRNAEVAICVGKTTLIFRDHKGNGVTDTSENISIDTWHHYAGTYDYTTGTARVYLDGQLRKQGAEGIYTPGGGNGSFHMGSVRDGCNGVPFVGDLDEVRLYRYVLLPEEVQDLYTNP